MQESSSPEITLIAKITAKPGLEKIVLAELQALIAPTRAEPGCLQYDLHCSVENVSSFLFVERWRSQADIANHFDMPYLKALKAKESEILAQPVEITLWKSL